MILLTLLLASSSPTAPQQVAGEYLAVTETEYAIELKLAPSGHAQFDFHSWEADSSAAEVAKVLEGKWRLSGSEITVSLTGGKSATYAFVPCLTYQEFGQPGCSPGLELVKTNLPDQYGLQRFGLWRSDGLRIQP